MSISASHSEAREQLLDSAIAAGKIIPSRRGHYAQMYDRDPSGTVSLINLLASGISSQQATELSAERRQGSPSGEYDQHWLSEGERRRLTAAHAGHFSRVIKADD